MNVSKRSIVIAAAIGSCLTTLFVFLPALHNDFVNLDDYVYVVFNRRIAGFGADLFKSSFLSFQADLWIPLTWISLAIDYRFWGLDPWGYHLQNILLHSANVFFVSFLTASLIDAAKTTGAADTPPGEVTGCRFSVGAAALAAGLMFGIHPLRVESVAWVTERKDVLNAFFILPAFLCYIGYARRERSGTRVTRWSAGRLYIGTFILFTASLFCKPITVTFPVLLLVLDWFPLGRIRTRKDIVPLVREKTPFFLASIAVSLVTVIAQRGTMQSLDYASPAARLLVAAKAVIFYLDKFLWPSGLMPFYVHPGNSVSLLSPEYFIPTILLAGLSVAAVRRSIKGDRIWLAVWLFYLIALFPVLGLLQAGPQAMADRFTYLPALAPTALMAAAIGRLAAAKASSARVAALAVVVALPSGFIPVTERLIGVWRTTETLWTRVIDLAPQQSGRAYYERGKHYAFTGDYERGLRDAAMSLEIGRRKGYRNVFRIHSLQGECYLGLGKYPEALAEYDRAIAAANPPQAELHAARGRIRSLMGDGEAARRDAARAEELNRIPPGEAP